MKKIILILIILSLLFLPRNVNAQAELDCRKVYDKEDYKCLGVFNECNKLCVDSAYAGQSLEIDGGKLYKECVKANNCHEESEACSKKAQKNYRTCLKSGKEATSAEAKQETPKQGEKSTSQNIDDWIMENNLITDIAQIEQIEREKLDLELYGRTPQMTEEIIKKAQEEWEAMFAKTGKESVVAVSGQGQLKSPELDQFITVTAKDDPIYYTYFGEVVSVPKWAEIKFLKPIQDEKTQELKRMLKLNKGEVEIKVKNANSKNKYGVQGDFFDLFVIQTHFWVNQSQDKKLAVIGVYEGEVEVKTKDGKTIKVKPDGDKPGVVVVTQKLSIVKLAAAGVAVTVVFVGTIFILRRFLLKSFKKRK